MQDYKNLKVLELEKLARERKIFGYSRLNKAGLIRALVKNDKQALELNSIPEPESKKSRGRPTKEQQLPSFYLESGVRGSSAIDQLIRDVENRGLTLQKTITIKR